MLEAIALDRQVAGTCFLTCDSLFVTARHCVEPWINDEDWNGISYDDKMSPAVRLATMAETRNMMLGEEKYKVKAHCIISKVLNYMSIIPQISILISREIKSFVLELISILYIGEPLFH